VKEGELEFGKVLSEFLGGEIFFEEKNFGELVGNERVKRFLSSLECNSI